MLRSAIKQLILALLFILSVVAFVGCKQARREEVAQQKEQAEVSLPEGVERELPAIEIYPAGIKPTEEVRKVIEKLDEIRIKRLGGEEVEVKPSLLSEVKALMLEKDVPLDNKVWLVYELSRAGSAIDDQLLLHLDKLALKQEITPELAFTLAVLNREKYLTYLKGEITDVALATSRIIEFGRNSFEFFKKAYELRDREALYAFALLGAYYDLALSKLGGKVDKEALKANIPGPERSKLMKKIEQSVGLRSLIGPPWLVYEVDMYYVSPVVYKDCEIWGAWNSSVKDTLLLFFEDALQHKDYGQALRLIGMMRFVATWTPNTIDTDLYAADMVIQLAEIARNEIKVSKYKKELKKIVEEAKDYQKAWLEDAEKTRQKINRYIADDIAEKAKEEDTAYVNRTLPQVISVMDNVEDVLKRLKKEEEKKQAG